MENYKHILIATDATEQSRKISKRAFKLTQVFGARLSILQVLENLPADIPVDPVPPEGVDKIRWLQEYAQDSLSKMAKELGMVGADINVVLGTPKQEIARFAKEQDVDLIVVGAHERHGIAVLFGSTTDSVVHKAPCDVLAVHIER